MLDFFYPVSDFIDRQDDENEAAEGVLIWRRRKPTKRLAIMIGLWGKRGRRRGMKGQDGVKNSNGAVQCVKNNRRGPRSHRGKKLSHAAVKEMAVLMAGCINTFKRRVDVRLNVTERMTFVSIWRPDRHGCALVGIPKEENGFLPMCSCENLDYTRMDRLGITSMAEFVHCDGYMFMAYTISRIVQRDCFGTPPSARASQVAFGLCLLTWLLEKKKLESYPCAISVYGRLLDLDGEEIQAEKTLRDAVKASQDHCSNAYVNPYCDLADHCFRRKNFPAALEALVHGSSVAARYKFTPRVDCDLEMQLHVMIETVLEILKNFAEPDLHDAWTICHVLCLLDNLFLWAAGERVRGRLHSHTEHTDSFFHDRRDKVNQSQRTLILPWQRACA